jgi:Tfp pilus assembly protein PilE
VICLENYHLKRNEDAKKREITSTTLPIVNNVSPIRTLVIVVLEATQTTAGSVNVGAVKQQELQDDSSSITTKVRAD